MYEFYSEEKINQKYPILINNEEAIILFVSTDAVWGYGISEVIKIRFPRIYQSYKHYCIDNKKHKIKKGMILSQKVKDFDKYIICSAIKEDFMEKLDYNSLKECLIKLQAKIQELKLNHIAVQECFNISEELIIKALNDLVEEKSMSQQEMESFIEKIKFYKKSEFN